MVLLLRVEIIIITFYKKGWIQIVIECDDIDYLDY